MRTVEDSAFFFWRSDEVVKDSKLGYITILRRKMNLGTPVEYEVT
jgi:hypothetical protein